MAIPVNTDATTAIAIPSLDYATTQDVNDGATTYTVWYKYTATSADAARGAIGVWGFGSVAVGAYHPVVHVYTGPASAPVDYLGIGGTNIPVQVPVTAGVTYYFRFLKLVNTATALLQVSVLKAPYETVPVDAIGINDDSPGFPLVFIDRNTGNVLRFKQPFPAGEALWALPTSEIGTEDNSTTPTSFKIFDTNQQQIAAPSLTSLGSTGALFINANDTDGVFYVGREGIGGTHALVTTVSKTGVQGATTWDLGAVRLVALAPSPDNTILYYVGETTIPATNKPIRRWDLVNDVALSDLAAGIATFFAKKNMIVLPDGTVLVGYNGVATCKALHYSAAGATLFTYDITALTGATSMESLFTTSDDGSTFGVWSQPSFQYSLFTTISVATGAIVLATPQSTKYETGNYQGAASATPSARFGHSQSCLPFTVRVSPTTDQRKPVPIPVSAAPRIPCVPDAQVSNGGKGEAGCTVGGVGFTSQLIDYGEVPQHPDPVDGETLTGKDLLRLGFWIEIYHTDPSDVLTIYRRALGAEIADLDTYEGGRKSEGVLTVGDIEHGLGNEQGDDEAATIEIEYSDIVDRLFRDLLESDELEGDEVYIKAATKQAREGSPTTPARVFMRGKIQRTTLTSGLRVAITAVDPLFSEDGPFGPGKLWPPAIPASLWSSAPPDTVGMTFPVLYGEKSDEGAVDPVSGALSEKGLVPLIYIGQQDLTDYGGASPALVPIVEDLGIAAPVIKALTKARYDIPDGWIGPTYAFIAAVIDGAIGTVSAVSSVGGDPGIVAGTYIHFDRIVGDADSYVGWVSDDATYHPVTNPTAGRVGTATHYGRGENDYIYTRQFLEGDPDILVMADYSMLVTPAAASAGADIWDAYLVVLGASYRIISIFGSDLGGGNETKTHDRIKLVIAERNGSDILTPWDGDGNLDPNWPFADPFIDYTDPETGIIYRCTVIFARGPLSDDHKNGVVNMTANVIGRDEVGDSTGRALVHAMRVYQSWLENDILLNYTSGLLCTNSTAPQWRDGVYMVRSSSFTTREDFLLTSVGGIGLEAGWYVGEAKPVTEWIREWNRSTEIRTGRNGHGQIVVFGLDETVDPTTWAPVRHVSDLFGPVTRVSGEERENVVVGSCDWDPDAEKFRIGPLTVTSDSAIARYKGRRKEGEPVDSSILNKRPHLEWTINRRLARLQVGTTTVEITGSMGLLDTDVGSGLSVTSIEGIGAGYVGHPFHVLRRRINLSERLVTDTLWDVKNILIATAFENGLDRILYETDDAGLAPVETDDPDLAPLEIL